MLRYVSTLVSCARLGSTVALRLTQSSRPPLQAMPARSNRAIAAAAAASSAWQDLISSVARLDHLHHVKVVCLDVAPSTSDTVQLMCFAPNNTPLAIGMFLCEDGNQHVFPSFSTASTTHSVFEVIFMELPDEDGQHEGIILAIKDGHQCISAANLQHLRSQMNG